MYNQWFEAAEKQLQGMKQVLGENNEEYMALMQECETLEEKMAMAEQKRLARVIDEEERKLIMQWETLEAKIHQLIKSAEYQTAKRNQEEDIICKYIRVLKGKLGKAEIDSIDEGIKEVLKAWETVSKSWNAVEGKKTREEMTRLLIDRNIAAIKQGKPIQVESILTLCGEKAVERLFTEKCQELLSQEGMSEEEKWKINMLLIEGISVGAVRQEELWEILAGVQTVTIKQPKEERAKSDSYIIARIQKPNGKIIEKKVSVREFEREGYRLPKKLGLVGVTIPSSVKEIGDHAFADCDTLEEVILQEGLERIGTWAFFFSGIKRITIPSSVKEIGIGDFCDCRQLEEIILQEGLERIGPGAFNKTGIKRVTIPSSVKEIEACAFEACDQLEEVILQEGLERIGPWAFNKTGIKRATIPSSVKEIGEYAFLNCNKLEEVILQEGLERIGNLAFGFSGIKRITIPSSVKEIGEYAFADCDKLEEIILPEGLNAETIKLPPNVKITIQKKEKEQEER